MSRHQPLPPASVADLNARLRIIAERAEQHRREQRYQQYASQVLAVAIEMARAE